MAFIQSILYIITNPFLSHFFHILFNLVFFEAIALDKRNISMNLRYMLITYLLHSAYSVRLKSQKRHNI
jgi:hypothetical protein